MNRILHFQAAEDALGLERNLMWNPTGGVNEEDGRNQGVRESPTVVESQ